LKLFSPIVLMRCFVICDTSDVMLGHWKVFIQIVKSRKWVFQCWLYIFFYLHFDLFIKIFKFVKCRPTVFNEHMVNILDWIPMVLSMHNLINISISNTWISHWVIMKSVSPIFNAEWPIFKNVIFGKLHCLSDNKDILSIHSNSWNKVTSFKIVCVVGSSRIWCTHSIHIIFANKTDWELP